MRIHSLHPTVVLAAACLLTVLLFLPVIATPEVHFWGRYLLPIVIVYLWGRGRDIYLVTALASMLVLAGFWREGTQAFGDLLFNHLLPGTILWAAAWLLAQHKRLQEQLAAQRQALLHQQQELAEQVAARTAELQASQQRYRLLADNATDLVWALDLDGTPTYVSPSVARLLGVTSAEETAVWTDRMPPEAAAVAGQLLRADLAAVRAGLAVDTNARVGPVLQKDGRLIWVETIVSPVYDQAGKAVGLCGVTRDITARHEVEARLRAVIENTADSVWSIDCDYRLLVANSVFGRSVQQLIGRCLALGESVLADLYSPEVRAFWQPLYDRALAGERFMVEIPSNQLPGSTLACYLNPIYAGDCTVTGASARVADVTELKHYQRILQDANAELEQRVVERTSDLQAALAELQAANQLKDEFMAMISHELRTPLTGVLSLSELLREQIAGPLTDRQVTYVRGIRESGERLLYVINSILSYTQLLSGRLRLRHEPCDLRYLVHVCAVSQRAKAEAKQQVIEELVEPAGLSVESDGEAIAEVLKRLLDNAIKFTPVGGRVGLAVHSGAAPGSVRLVVWDTGQGLAAEELERLVRPFAQGDGSLARSYDGIGMGLAYVDQMVRLLGGTLELAPNLGGGCCFTITLSG